MGVHLFEILPQCPNGAKAKILQLLFAVLLNGRDPDGIWSDGRVLIFSNIFYVNLVLKGILAKTMQVRQDEECLYVTATPARSEDNQEAGLT